MKVLNKLFGVHAFTKQQTAYLVNNLMCDKSRMTIQYSRLYNVLDIRGSSQNYTPGAYYNNNNTRESWHEDEDEQFNSSRSFRSRRSLTNKSTLGSIGEWMEASACPAEMR